MTAPTNPDEITSRPLTSPDTLALAAIILAAQDGVKVARVMPDDHPLAGETIYGIARHIVIDDSAIFPGRHDDIRACSLRVTSGTDYFWPMSELVGEYQAATFCLNVS